MNQSNLNYFAFISYSGNDERYAKWLHSHLEGYHIPTAICKDHDDIPKHLRPIFWYKKDLSGTKLKQALDRELDASRFLIVLCSPSSAKSEWVNDEVQSFIDHGKEDHIIPLIIGGTPHSGGADECFPPALRQLSRQEEIRGINMREAGRERALVDVVATMLGVRFDALWQRHRRRQRRNRIIAGTLAFMLVLLGIFVYDYKRATYEYYADYVDTWGVPQGVVQLSAKQAESRRRFYRFEYRRTPFGQHNAYGWRLVKMEYVNSAMRPQQITDMELKERYPVQEIEYNPASGTVWRINFKDKRGKVMLRHVLSERNGDAACVADFIDAQEQKGSSAIGADLTSMSMGQMDADQKKSSIVRYVYERDTAGHIIRQTYHSNNDYSLTRSATSDADGIYGRTFTLDSLGRRTAVKYLDSEGRPKATKRGVAGKLYEYDRHGNMSKVTYIGLDAQPIANERKWAIGISESDEMGNIVAEVYFDMAGRPTPDSDNVARYAFAYDARGNRIEEAYFNAVGTPTLSRGGFHKLQFQYDRAGNVTEAAAYDTEGAACYDINTGASKSERKYDQNGNLIEEQFYASDGNKCYSSDGVSKMVLKYDGRGNEIERAFFDTEGNPTCNNAGVACYGRAFDDRDNLIEFTNYDAEGNVCFDKDGEAKIATKYDERGNQIEWANYGPDGLLSCNKKGIAKSRREHDDRGNIITESYFGADSEPCYDINGVSCISFQYDAEGNLSHVAYFDPEGNPCYSTAGIASWSATYHNGLRTSVKGFDVNGNLCVGSDGTAIVEYKYDSRGNRIEIAQFDADQQLCPDNDGVAIYRKTYDRDGNVTVSEYFGPDDNPCLYRDSFAKFVAKYDGRGNRVEISYYDRLGNRCTNLDNVSIVKYTYDDYGNVTRQDYYDTTGRPCADNVGVASFVWSYDAHGNLTEQRCYAADGSPCDAAKGISIIKHEYDNVGNQTSLSYYDVNDKLSANNQYAMAMVKYEYDKNSNCIGRYFYDADLHPITNPEGVYSLKHGFDSGNYCISTTSYGANGEKMMCNYGFCSIMYEHDSRFNQTAMEYRDTEGNPVNVFGYFRKETEYDSRNLPIATTYYDAEGNVLANQVETDIAVIVHGVAAAYNLPTGSVLVKWNSWRIGHAHELLVQEMRKSKYGRKELTFITPQGLPQSFVVEKGLLGIQFQGYQVEKAQADEWLKLLDL